MNTERSEFFCSYAREDSEFVLKLAKDLRKAGVGLWVDQLDILGGERWDEAVEAALTSCEGVLAVLSPSALASQNVMDEIAYALEERKQVIPVLCQECNTPFRLRRVQHIGFVDDYQHGFAKLVRALRIDRRASVAAASRRETSKVVPPVERQRKETIAQSIRPDKVRSEVEQSSDSDELEVWNLILQDGDRASGSETVAAPISADFPEDFRARLIPGLIGLLTGALVGASCAPSWWVQTLSYSMLGGTVGVICGRSRKMLAMTLVAAVVVGSLAFFGFGERSWRSVVSYIPSGALIGVMVADFAGRRLRKS